MFIDIDRRAIEVIRRNIQMCELAENTRTVRWDITRNLNCIRGRRPLFNLVFMDPPYGRKMIASALNRLHASDCLEQGALLVAEHTPVESIPCPLDAYRLLDRRIYGKRLVSFLSYMV